MSEIVLKPLEEEIRNAKIDGMLTRAEERGEEKGIKIGEKKGDEKKRRGNY